MLLNVWTNNVNDGAQLIGPFVVVMMQRYIPFLTVPYFRIINYSISLHGKSAATSYFGFTLIGRVHCGDPQFCRLDRGDPQAVGVMIAIVGGSILQTEHGRRNGP